MTEEPSKPTYEELEALAFIGSGILMAGRIDLNLLFRAQKDAHALRDALVRRIGLDAFEAWVSHAHAATAAQLDALGGLEAPKAKA